MEKSCRGCGKTFTKPSSNSLNYWATRKYCSHFCYSLTVSASQKGKIVSDITRQKISDANKGQKPSLLAIINSVKARKGKPSRNKGLPAPWAKNNPQIFKKRHKLGVGRKISEETRKKMGLITHYKGIEHWNWKGGVSAYKSIYVRRRNEQLKNATGRHSGQEWEDLKKLYNYMCLCCKQQEPFIKLTEDHITPISRGGTNDISNIQPLCSSCNRRKYVSTINYKETFNLQLP
jgi:hypothetical protein